MKNRKKPYLFILVILLGGVLSSRLGAAQPRMIPESFADVAEKSAAAVVNISTVRIYRQTLPGQLYSNDPRAQEFFEQFFGEQFYRDIPQKNLGSGVIVDHRGYVLTNNHVVEKASEIKIKLEDGKEYTAEILGTDPKTDLAVLKLKGRDNWPAAELGDSDKLRVGDWVLAMGSPFGLEHTVTAGIISAKSRTIGQGPYDDFLQTDASINPGNSGGPLINMEGKVVGINTAIVSSTGGGSLGIGFAIPVNTAAKIYQDLIKTGVVKRGWMGIYIQPLTPELAQQFKFKQDQPGILITAVVEEGPADRAGLKPGDIVTKFNNKLVTSANDMVRQVAETSEDRMISLEIFRNGTLKQLKVRVGDQTKAESGGILKAREASGQEDIEAGLLGMAITEINAKLARKSGIRNRAGVLVESVVPGSPAEGAGIMPGDVIRELNRQGIKNQKQFVQFLKALKPGEDLLLLVERNGYAIYVAMKIPGK